MRRGIEHFIDEFDGYQIVVDCEQPAPNSSWVLSVQIYRDGEPVLPRCDDSDRAYATAEEAKRVGVGLGRNIIRNLSRQ
ncbi:DUF6566 family protein [Burkholderia pseudomallei]|uniref:DUF6566 family protein n=1 Tax=Burkholderia pseudomallei TaxID=28450 RepID=UPI000162AF84|nr:hypothetical protein 1.14 [Burkholderia phage Bups phi1]AHE30757.1 hypothetical protein BBJ_5522 [Burkholderia pseudomallei NCTC 13178]OMW99898.1 hypothetical protein AQ819_15630 [Burkholderia pseudomallei]ONC75081.1 hypothetical protein AQ921_06960 [Burkholderia pseudomallei]